MSIECHYRYTISPHFLQIYFYDVQTQTGVQAQRGIGSDMATLDSAYFLSQVLLSLLMGYVVALSGTVLAYVVCACGVGAVASACSVRIIFSKQQINLHMNKTQATFSVWQQMFHKEWIYSQ